MDEPVKLEVHRGRKKEICRFCGKEAHADELCCPRIRAFKLSDSGHVETIFFWEWWSPDDDPDLAG
jgi:hypothetical protein